MFWFIQIFDYFGIDGIKFTNEHNFLDFVWQWMFITAFIVIYQDFREIHPKMDYSFLIVLNI